MASFFGDLRLKFALPEAGTMLGYQARFLLADYAVNKRRSHYYAPFQQVLGYWHSFHLPFAIFMYVVAVIHIVSALLFGVGS